MSRTLYIKDTGIMPRTLGSCEGHWDYVKGLVCEGPSHHNTDIGIILKTLRSYQGPCDQIQDAGIMSRMLGSHPGPLCHVRLSIMSP